MTFQMSTNDKLGHDLPIVEPLQNQDIATFDY